MMHTASVMRPGTGIVRVGGMQKCEFPVIRETWALLGKVSLPQPPGPWARTARAVPVVEPGLPSRVPLASRIPPISFPGLSASTSASPHSPSLGTFLLKELPGITVSVLDLFESTCSSENPKALVRGFPAGSLVRSSWRNVHTAYTCSVWLFETF